MNRIKQLRKERGMTQPELGRVLNVQGAAISKYENEKVPLTTDTIKTLASFFNVSTGYLLCETDDAQVESVDDNKWRFPSVNNRLGKILQQYRERKNLSELDLASKLDISEELEINIELGVYSPSYELIEKISKISGYEVDYLTGAVNHTSVDTSESIDICGSTIPIYTSEYEFCFHSRFEEEYINHSITTENVHEKLGISAQDFIDIKYNRMPTLSELLRFSYAFNVSTDYLIGKSDTPFSSLSSDELELILNYRDCIDPYKQSIRERAEKLSLDSLGNSSVAADELLRKAK